MQWNRLVTVGQTVALQLLKQLGGRATAEQLRIAARKQDPFSEYKGMSASLWRLRAWKEVSYDLKSNTWYVNLPTS